MLTGATNHPTAPLRHKGIAMKPSVSASPARCRGHGHRQGWQQLSTHNHHGGQPAVGWRNYRGAAGTGDKSGSPCRAPYAPSSRPIALANRHGVAPRLSVIGDGLPVPSTAFSTISAVRMPASKPGTATQVRASNFLFVTASSEVKSANGAATIERWVQGAVIQPSGCGRTLGRGRKGRSGLPRDRVCL
jgi:hypothetical protein